MYGKERNGRGGGSREHDQRERSQRPPLQFNEVHTLSFGKAAANISKANGERGSLYSFRLGRLNRDGKFVPHLTLDQVADIPDLVKAVEAWILGEGGHAAVRD